MASWLHRTVLAGLLLTAYLYAWTPLRTQWTKGITVVLEQVAPEALTVSSRPQAHHIRVEKSQTLQLRYTAPAGVKFLLPALFLILIAPARPRIGPFLAGHAGLAAIAAALGAAGLAGLPGGLGLASFVQLYGVDAYSLAVPVLVFAGGYGRMVRSSDAAAR
jgi:hypothetical protein